MPHLDPLQALTAFRASLPSAARLYVAGGSGEPAAIVDAFRAKPDLAAHITFIGAWIPGINLVDWASLAPDARMETIFMSGAFRASFEAGRTALMPFSYSRAWSWLQQTRLDGAVIMVSPPDADGRVSLGVSVDFSEAILGRPDIPVLGLINHNMPRPLDGPSFPISRFAIMAETTTPLIELQPTKLSPALHDIATHISGQISDGDMLQFGLGTVQQAVLAHLKSHRDLRIHTGMVSDPLLDLLDDGSISTDAGAVVTGVALGTPRLYERVSSDTRFQFRSVPHTHGLDALSALPNFRAINSAVEIDLFGQINAEFMNGQQISGTGGLADFLRGAANAPDGRSIVALPATTKGGRVSRIVPCLNTNITTISRADTDTVITEFGIANLKYKSLDARATALIDIAAPDFRDQLSDQWDAIRRTM